MSCRNRFKARMRWARPASMRFHSAAATGLEVAGAELAEPVHEEPAVIVRHAGGAEEFVAGGGMRPVCGEERAVGRLRGTGVLGLIHQVIRGEHGGALRGRPCKLYTRF